MVAPSGEQFEFSGGRYRAVVTECGATLRGLWYDDRPLLAGFDETAVASAGRGQLLMPWPNRIGDGAYEFGNRHYQLPLTEVARRNASHGLVRWAAWTREEHTAHSVSLVYRLMAQSGYPWTLDLHVLYDLSADGLTVTQTATNLSPDPAPYASGAHPYLLAGSAGVDRWELTLPARTRLLVDDDRKLPVGTQDVSGSVFDYAISRPIGDTVLDHAFTDVITDDVGVVRVVVRDADSGTGVSLWADREHRWLQVYTGDDLPSGARRSLAVEPMTSPPDAFRSGDDLRVLAPAGQPGDELSVSWGISFVG